MMVRLLRDERMVVEIELRVGDEKRGRQTLSPPLRRCERRQEDHVALSVIQHEVERSKLGRSLRSINSLILTTSTWPA